MTTTVDPIDCPDRCPPAGTGHEHWTHVEFAGCPGRCDQPGAHPSAAHLPALWELTSRDGRLRRYSRGYGAALIEAYATTPIAGAIGERLRAEYEQAFPPSLGEYR